MSDKALFLRIWDREFQTTVRVLKAYPPDKLDLKPHVRSRSVRELAWQFVVDEGVMQKILDGQIDLRNAPAPPPAPQTLEEIVAGFEDAHKAALQRICAISEAEFNKTLTFVTGTGFQVSMPKPDIFWSILLDEIHHRGQLTIYLRLAGGKVPSIYGPSADEPAKFA